MSTVKTSPSQTMEIINATPTNQIAELDFVKDKFIQNYNVCNPGGMGDLIYARNLAHLKQAIMASPDLQKVDRFSVYAAIMTIAVNGYSIDPQDNEVYLIPRGGKMCLQRQAPAHIKRLQRTEQIKYANNAVLVYKGDTYEVERGKVIKHVEKFESDEIIAGYIIFVLDEAGTERHITYRKSDWESWRQSSPQLNGPNWRAGSSGQPKPGFLKTKIVAHACQEKCWAAGRTPAVVEIYETEMIDGDEAEAEEAEIISQTTKQPQHAQHAQHAEDNAAFAPQVTEQPKATTITHDDDNF